jgi:hypothetical protein
MRKIRLVIQVGSKKDYTLNNFVEIDVTHEVRDEEDMVKHLRFLLTDQFKAVEKRMGDFPESRPLIENAAQKQEFLE